MNWQENDLAGESRSGGNNCSWVTPAAVRRAMEGFPLALGPGKDFDWLAMAIRRSMALSVEAGSLARRGPSAAQIRDTVLRLAGAVQSTFVELSMRDEAVDARLADFTKPGGQAGGPGDYRRFSNAILEMEWMADFLTRAALTTEISRGPRLAERRRRIEHALYLIPIFEIAFGRRATANNWPSGSERAPSAFMDFYQRAVAVAFNERVTPDISGILKAAGRLHRKYPAKFGYATQIGNGLIPGL